MKGKQFIAPQGYSLFMLQQQLTPSQISIVLATWCPHCVPLSLEMARKMARELGVPLRVLDIDDKDLGRTADAIVEEHGDYSEDYIVPQIFFEFSDGSVKHAFTGFSESTEITRKRLEDIFQSKLYQSLRS
ncbi:MAG: glutaredoxin family protein [Nitrososphaerales archaeon]